MKSFEVMVLKLSLKYLILFTALLSVGLTMASSIMSGYRVSREALMENTLEMNHAYAQKIAYTTDSFLEEALDTLSFSADKVSQYLKENREDLLFDETNRLLEQTRIFNSVAVVSKAGYVKATSPEMLGILGEKITSTGGKQALSEKVPLVSEPYMSMTGRLIVLISYPIFDSVGNYEGYISGSIYLLEDNALSDLLGSHFYQDGSYFYVVDGKGKILYHPDSSRINDIVMQNVAIKETTKGENGSVKLTNSKGIPMLAGYANIPVANWGTVSQTETKVAVRSAISMRNQMLINTIPSLLLSLLVISFISNRIAKPLYRLGNYAEMSIEKKDYEKVKKVGAWYYEAIQLEKVLVKSFALWEDRVNFFIYQSTIDPLTGLANRRFMGEQMKKWTDNHIEFTILLLDIDRFKKVNDTYGHALGDEVLKFLANEMRLIVRESDICCRYGGEEFMILMPETTGAEAYFVAERLRKTLELKASPTGKSITVSGGIANSKSCGNHVEKMIEVADERLYKAKETGRNKIVGVPD